MCEPFDMQGLLSAVCHYFTGSKLHKLLQRRVRVELRGCSKSCREDSEKLFHWTTEAFVSTEHATTTRTLGKRSDNPSSERLAYETT